jgi:tungstate transport system substrate-binding protein
MYNDFVIVGPASDPAGIRGLNNAEQAFEKIAMVEAPFASRGDNSGTHKAELKLWKKTKIDPLRSSGNWYLETGSGMGATLNTAVGKSAYALADRGTWLGFANKNGFEVLVEGNRQLLNQYGVILVNPDKHPNVKAGMGETFVDWLTSTEGQKAIASFKIDGHQLFFPNARPGV